jgi:hypothetical protein
LPMPLISECYQTFNRQPAEVQPDTHDISAYEIGKWMNGYANPHERFQTRYRICLRKRRMD